MAASHSPIALFVYARPAHTQRTLAMLAANRGAEESDVIVFADGSRGPDSDAGVAAVRAVVRAAKGFRSVVVHERPQNYGLARNIIDGVSQVLAEHETVIVVEDDMETSPGFLDYINGGLRYFAEDERVASIHGYVYAMEDELPEAFFIRGADCWGWGTWRRAWRMFEPDGAKLLAELKRRDLTRLFDFDGTYPYTEMLRRQIDGKVNSWAIRWYASAFLAGALTLYPRRSFVRNIGFDGSGVHSGSSNKYDVDLADTVIDFSLIPVEDDARARRAFMSVLSAVTRRKTLLQKLRRSIGKRLAFLCGLFGGPWR